jgi:Domain of unknown function (DUF927)
MTAFEPDHFFGNLRDDLDPQDQDPVDTDLGADLPAFDQDEALEVLGAPKAADSHRWIIPPGYKLDGNGVWKTTIVKAKRKDEDDTERTELVASAPCLISGLLVDDEGNELLELAWLHYKTWKRRTVQREHARSGRRLVTAVAGAGFPVMDSTSRKIEAWLDIFESYNRDRLPTTTIARRLGWQPDRSFVTSDGHPSRVHPIPGLEPVVHAHRPQGDLDGWKAAIGQLDGHPIAQMGVAASLAAPLLELLDLSSFTVDFSGQTTTGKTTTLEAGLSVWADPQAAMANWNGTRLSLENRLAILKGVPAAIDETSNAAGLKVDTIRDMLYSIPQGRSKALGRQDGGSRPSVTWQTVVLSSGERSILSFTRDGGTAARVLELVGSPFGDDGRQAAIAVREGVYAHHGVAGAAFVFCLQKYIADVGQERLRDRHRKATERLLGDGALAKRRAPLIAALALAATLAHDFGILPYQAPTIATWKTLFHREETSDDRPGEALQVIRNFLAANQVRVEGSEAAIDADRDPSQGWIGKELRGGAVAVSPELVVDLLRKAGYEYEAVKLAWAERGLTRRDGKHLACLVRFGAARARYVVFEPDAGDDQEAE